MALIGNMINESFAGNPATINYTMFVSAFSMFTLLYLTPATFNPDWAIHPILMIVLDVLNAIFFLTSGIALAAKLESHSCSNNVRACPLHSSRSWLFMLVAAPHTGYRFSMARPTVADPLANRRS